MAPDPVGVRERLGEHQLGGAAGRVDAVQSGSRESRRVAAHDRQALGSFLAARLRLSFETALLLAIVGVVSITVTLPLIATGYAALYRAAAVG